VRRVILESPYAGDRDLNERYLSAALADSVARGESPYASHAILTRPGVLDDEDPGDRRRGIEAGFAWRDVADATVVYADLGISDGMRRGIADAHGMRQDVELRYLVGWEQER